jgi:N-acetylmuramoyl-L-alanine amidase
MKIVKHILEGVPFVEDKHLNITIKPEILVWHYTATSSGPATVKALENIAASVHFVVDVDGSIVQMVPCNKRAGHAGDSMYGGKKDVNGCSIGIEIVNLGYLALRDGKYYDHAGREYRGEVVEARSRQWPRCRNQYWAAYTDAQIDTVAALSYTLVREYSLVDAVGHEDITSFPGRIGGGKVDPGPAFPYEWMREVVLQ